MIALLVLIIALLVDPALAALYEHADGASPAAEAEAQAAGAIAAAAAAATAQVEDTSRRALATMRDAGRTSNTPAIAVARRGFCAPTVDGDNGDCDAGHRGSWLAAPSGVTTIGDCAALCGGCPRCNYVSFSADANVVVGTTSAIWMRYARTLAQRISRWRLRGSQSHPAWTAARTVLLLQARVAAAQDGGVGGGVRSGRGPTQLPPRHAASPACVGPLGVEESATREQATPAARGRPRRKRLRLSPTARLPAVLVLAAPTYRTRGLSAIAPGSASATCRTSAGRLPTASTT